MSKDKKNGAGLSDDESKVMSFRLQIDVHDAFLAKIKESGLTRSEYIRDYVLVEKTTVYARPRASLYKKKMLFLVNKISNNINQLAHRANSEAKACVINEKTHLAILTELQAISGYLKKVLGNVD